MDATQPHSVWHFFGWGAFAATVLAAGIGVWALQAKRWISVVLLLAVITTSVWSGIENAVAQREAERQNLAARSTNVDLQSKLTAATGKLEANTRELGAEQEKFAKIVEAAHLPPNTPPGEIVTQIIGKLSNNSGNVLGSNSGAVVGGKGNNVGVNAGANSTVTGNNFYNNSTITVNESGHRVIERKAAEHMAAALRKSGEAATVQVVMIGTDTEVAQFGAQLAQVLNTGGWHAVLNTGIGDGHNPGFLGLGVGVKDEAHPPEAAQALVRAMRASGIPVIGPATDNVIKGEDEVNLIVGGRPGPAVPANR